MEASGSGQRAWPPTKIVHEGIARAEFSDPSGWVRGPASARVDEQGHLDVEMQVEECCLEEESHGHSEVTILLTGCRPHLAGSSMVLLFSGEQKNTCKNFEMETENGIFRTGSSILYSFHLWDENSQLTIHPLWAQFDAAIGGQAKYWAMPLSNLLTRFFRDDSGFSGDTVGLEDHPLRIGSVSGLDPASPDAGLIPFEFGGRPGFIEPTHSYEKQAEELSSGRARNRVTAVMVGEVGGEDCADLEMVEGWFPFFFHEVLGLATGSEVGSPWLEFRDAEARLVRRIYTRATAPCYFRGHRAIDQALHQGIGELLTKAARPPGSDELRKSYLRVCIKHAIRAKLIDTPFEEQLAHVFRAVDALCEYFELKKGPNLKKLIRQDTRTDLNRIIKNARREIEALGRRAKEAGESAEAEVLKRISERVPGAKNLAVGFGRAVEILLGKFDLTDASIMSAYYDTNPRNDKKEWHAILSMYRGAVLHPNYLGISREDKSKLYDALPLIDHMHDLVLRIALKLIGYEGYYQPTVRIHADRCRVDWAKVGTDAKDLGYGRHG